LPLIMKAPLGTNSPDWGVLLTCSGSTQYVCVSANWFQAFEYEAAKMHASSRVCWVMGVGLLRASCCFMMQLGAPWISACTYRSPSVRYFLTRVSLVLASFPAMMRLPVLAMHQWYFSNQ